MVTRLNRACAVRAFAKINLTLRVVGRDTGGYHTIRTTFQTIALHDTLSFTLTRGPFAIECDDSRCPTDDTNLVYQAADRLSRELGRGPLRGVHVRIHKRIPLEAGLGGGSSDAAATLRALTCLWRLRVPPERLHAIARRLGADVAFFLHGGTMLGVERGDLLFRLTDWPSSWIVLIVPPYGVRTADAYRWWDERRSEAPIEGAAEPLAVVPRSELTNDLQAPVAARHPDMDRLSRRLIRRGAYHAMMSGSGSSVFGLFDSEVGARRAAQSVAAGARTVVTRTVSRSRFARESRPAARSRRRAVRP